MLGRALILLGLACGAWLGGRRRRLDPPSGDRAPLVSVVIPARDEERNLPTLLDSLAAQTHAAHEVLVVDDGSTDATAAVARTHGATVLTPPPRPQGWLGKPWACHTGAATAAGTHLLFLDADVSLAPEAIARLAATHEHGLLSVQPHHRTERAYEELSLFPNVVGFLGTAAGAVGGWPRMRGAFGPCIVTRTDDYRAVGGHAAVHDQVVDDLALADAYRRAGLPVAGRLGGADVTYRMYPEGPAQLAEGWTKNLAVGATRVGAAASLGATAFVAACAGAVAGLLLDPSVATAATYVVAAAAVAALGRRVGTFRWWTALLFVVPLGFFVGVFLRSAGRTLLRRPVTWRGRTIPAGR